MKAFLAVLLVLVFACMAFSSAGVAQPYSPEVATASQPASGHVVVYSTIANSNDLLYIPVNSTNVQAYPVWHVYLFGSGSFSFKANGTTVETGVSLGACNFTYSWHTYDKYANASLVFSGVTYSFHAILSGILTRHEVESVSIVSSYPGQKQYLSVSPGQSGALMYPHWMVTFISTENTSYSINVNGQTIQSGTVVGTQTIDFNITGSTASVIIGLGTHVYKYPDEIIASTPIQKYYAPKPPSLAYTVSQYELGIAKAFVASGFAIAIALFTARKYLLEKEKREVMRI